ncbi:hypothetical protein CASFOL_015977 [Castilleja foliolosa]|uniref:Bifunctional inhibitor/plant lipid transfer protein/seed storage helical domain-containing protein n=1 Tax=Castilleja foliolosa TaxID=1961234 RepID=A0ABD3DGP4_9LAMI
MEKKTSTSFVGTLLCLAVIVIAVGGADESLATKCSAKFQKVTPCLPYATEKAPKPSKDCCDSVTDLKASDPACLCFIIQQIHNGSNAAVRSMGVQEARLLQLPSVCNLVNASVSECPRLLHLPPNSPDAAIFTNVSTAANTTTAPATGTGMYSPTTANSGFMHKPHQLAGCSVTFFMAMSIFFFHTFPLSS